MIDERKERCFKATECKIENEVDRFMDKRKIENVSNRDGKWENSLVVNKKRPELFGQGTNLLNGTE